MPVPRAQSLIDDYQGNSWFISNLTEGLTHQESLIHPEFEANCLNWVLGHIVWRRNVVLRVLGRETLWPDEISAVYATGAPALSSHNDARDLTRLREELDLSTRLIRQGLEEATGEFLDEVVETDRGEKTRFDHLAGFHWHETFHMGQIDMLRALALSQRGE